MKQRTKILTDVAVRLNDKFNLATGSDIQLFRSVRRGAWRPGNAIRPALTVVDDGQAIESPNDEEGRMLTLRYKIVIDLAENWDRQTPMEDWSDRVETIWVCLQNWMVVGTGMLRHDYISDDPFDVIVAQGKSETIWVIEMEARYVADVGDMDKA